MSTPTLAEPILLFSHPAKGKVLRSPRKFRPYIHVPAHMSSGPATLEGGDAGGGVSAISAVLESLLAEEFREAGVGEREIVCIRTISVRAPQQLDWRNILALREWLRPVAQEIRIELLMGGEPNLLRFKDETAALNAFAAEALSGSAANAWAWRQIGFWSEDAELSEAEALRQLRGALWRHKRAIPAVIQEMKGRGHGGALLSCLAGRNRGPVREASAAEGPTAIYRI